MGSCINLNHMVFSVSKLKLGDKIDAILMKNGINILTDLSDENEESLKRLPGIGYASARKILRAYNNFCESLIKNDRVETVVVDKPNENKVKVNLHPIIDKTGLSPKDKEIINFIINGYSQQKVSVITKLSNRTLRHRLAMLKIDYQANTIAQLVCNIFDEVYSISEYH